MSASKYYHAKGYSCWSEDLLLDDSKVLPLSISQVRFESTWEKRLSVPSCLLVRLSVLKSVFPKWRIFCEFLYSGILIKIYQNQSEIIDCVHSCEWETVISVRLEQRLKQQLKKIYFAF